MIPQSSEAEVIHVWRDLRHILVAVEQILRVSSPRSPLSLPLNIVVYLPSHLYLRSKLSQSFLNLRRTRRVLHSFYLTTLFCTCLALPDGSWHASASSSLHMRIYHSYASLLTRQDFYAVNQLLYMFMRASRLFRLLACI